MRLSWVVVVVWVLAAGGARGSVVIDYAISGQQLFMTGTNVLGLDHATFTYHMLVNAAAAPTSSSNVSGTLYANYAPLSATLTLSGSAVDGTYTASAPGNFQLINYPSGDDNVVLQTSSFAIASGKTITATFEPSLLPGVIADGSIVPPTFTTAGVDQSVPANAVIETFQGSDGASNGLYQLAPGTSSSAVPEPGTGAMIVGLAGGCLLRRPRAQPGVQKLFMRRRR